MIRRSAWALFLFALPVTSFPFFPQAMGGEALVRPLSLYPLTLLIFLAVLPRLLNRPVPGILLSLLPFVLAAVASSLLSLLRGIEPALGISVTARVLRGMSTLAIGCAIYLAIALLPDSVDDLRFSLRWIYLGCGLALFWGSLQAIYIIKFNQSWFNLLSEIQEYISIRRLLPDRVSGLTYEPHWFADQILILLLPALLSSVLSGYSVFHRRWGKVTVEWLLLGWAILLMPFTFSRSGVLNLILIIGLSFIFLRLHFRGKTAKNPVANPPAGKNHRINWQRLVQVALALVFIVVPIYFVGTRNLFFARLWHYWQKRGATLSGYMSDLGLDARLAYSEAAFRMYQAYPVLGVGLGNYAFYLDEMLPDRPLANIPEVMRMVTPEPGRDRLVTAKNFYLRLLAETGIVGAATFIAFIIANIGCALLLWLSPDPDWKFWGITSLCGLMAFSLSAFTFDSFVIPNVWVVFGLISAATRVLGQSADAHKGLLEKHNDD